MGRMNLVETCWRLSGVVALVVLVSAPEAGAAEPFYAVEIDSLESKGLFSSEPLKITGYVLEAETGGKTPGAVFAPACGGLMLPNGQLIRLWYRQMAWHLKRMGITSVLVDGFNPRGDKEICSQSPQDRTIDFQTRMEDSLAGLRYLRSRTDIDGGLVFLFTWGATGSFQAMNKGGAEVEKVGGGFAASIMFYPQCDRVDEPFSPYAPIQVFVGEKDAWNPPDPCLSLAKRKEPGSASLDIKIYPDSYHGFDLPRAPSEIDSPVGTVMVGGNPEAREDAYRRTAEFLSRFIPQKTPDGASARLPGGSQAHKRILSEEEIRQTIIGNTLNFRAPGSGRNLFVYYSVDGRVLVKYASGDRVTTKKWFIIDKNVLCRTYSKKNKKQCVRIARTDTANEFNLANEKVDFQAILLEGRQLPNQ